MGVGEGGEGAGNDVFTSFNSSSNYLKALMQSPQRLVNRIKTRSEDEAELQLKSQSQNEMKRTLNRWDLMWFSVGNTVGAGIFIISGTEARLVTGPSVFLAYIVAGFANLLTILCYIEFSCEIPAAGGAFSYLRVELGDFIAFLGAGNILLQYALSAAVVARSWTTHLAVLFGRKKNHFRVAVESLPEGDNLVDPLAVIICLVVSVIAVKSTKVSSRISYISTIIRVIVMIAIIIVGLTTANPTNLTPFMPYGVRGFLKSTGGLFFCYYGFDIASTMAEETSNPGKDMPISHLGSFSLTTLLYSLMSLTLCLMQPYEAIDTDSPFTKAFVSVGSGLFRYVIPIVVLEALTSVLLTQTVSQARYLTHIARTHMLPPSFAIVDQKTGTPVIATFVMFVVTAPFALFMTRDSLVDLLSISILLIYAAVAIALLVRRYYVRCETTTESRNKLIGFLSLIVLSSSASAIYYHNSEHGWIGYSITIPIWFVATAGLSVFVPVARAPKGWGVPLVPWLPSAAIWINIFLLATIDISVFIKFGVFTIGLLSYYFLFGLHVSYDNAMNMIRESQVERMYLAKGRRQLVA